MTTRAHKLAFCFIALLWLAVAAFTFQRAYDNPHLLASTQLEQLLTLQPTDMDADRYVSGTVRETGEPAEVRATRREATQVQQGEVLKIYRTGDAARPFLSAGQIAFMQPFYNFGFVTLSWRVFLGLGWLAGGVAAIALYRYKTATRPVLREVAILLAPALALLLNLGLGLYLLR